MPLTLGSTSDSLTSPSAEPDVMRWPRARRRETVSSFCMDVVLLRPTSAGFWSRRSIDLKRVDRFQISGPQKEDSERTQIINSAVPGVEKKSWKCLPNVGWVWLVETIVESFWGAAFTVFTYWCQKKNKIRQEVFQSIVQTSPTIGFQSGRRIRLFLGLPSALTIEVHVRPFNVSHTLLSGKTSSLLRKVFDIPGSSKALFFPNL